MMTLAAVLDAVVNCDEWQRKLAELNVMVVELRQQLTAETMRANQAQAKADFYYTMATEQAKAKHHE